MSDSHRAVENTLVNALLKERQRDRRWKIIRSMMWACIILLYAFLIFSPTDRAASSHMKKPYVSLIRMQGVIMPGRPFSALKIIPQLKHAFADKKSKGVLLVINSPGGSPVQATIIHDKILQLKKRYKKKVVVVGVDSLASGAYLVSTAADKIYVHNDTLTGSIGVIMSGFGLSDAIKKLGVTRRVFTAGKNKNRLDAFKPLTPNDTAKVTTLLNAVHQHFIDDVVTGRGNRLHGDHQQLFSGDFWEGSTAVALGLADDIGNTWEVMEKEFKVKHYRNYSAKPSLLHVMLGDIESQLHLTLAQQNNAQLSEKLQ